MDSFLNISFSSIFILNKYNKKLPHSDIWYKSLFALLEMPETFHLWLSSSLWVYLYLKYFGLSKARAPRMPPTHTLCAWLRLSTAACLPWPVRAQLTAAVWKDFTEMELGNEATVWTAAVMLMRTMALLHFLRLWALPLLEIIGCL